MMNKVQLGGILISKQEPKALDRGGFLISGVLRYYRKDKENRVHPEEYPFTAFNAAAELISELSEGSPVVLEGGLRRREFKSEDSVRYYNDINIYHAFNDKKIIEQSLLENGDAPF